MTSAQRLAAEVPRATFDGDPYYGVLVNNEVDEIRFGYLLKVLGPQKLWRAVAAYNRRWPDCKPFVSTLLKRYHIKVPTCLYAPKSPARPSVYLLVCADWTKFKIGFSERWRERIHSFSHHGELVTFDGDLTGAALFVDRATARRHEREIKYATSGSAVPPPAYVPYGAGGHGEWRTFKAYEHALELLCTSDARAPRPFEALRERPDA